MRLRGHNSGDCKIESKESGCQLMTYNFKLFSLILKKSFRKQTGNKWINSKCHHALKWMI